jgi:hypothetical protein
MRRHAELFRRILIVETKQYIASEEVRSTAKALESPTPCFIYLLFFFVLVRVQGHATTS